MSSAPSGDDGDGDALRTKLVGFAARHWPFANGSGRLIDRFSASISFGEGERSCATTDGFQMSVLAEDLIGRHLLLSGKFDRPTIAVLLEFGVPEDGCIDIGANIGYVSCLMLAKIEASHVVAIEPQPRVVDLLKRNLRQFDAARWEVIAAGLSDSDGSGLLELNLSNRGASRLVGDHAESSPTETVSVPLLSAARLLGEMDRLDLVKIDIEGHEERVLMASAHALERLQPRAILFEDQLGKAGPSGPIGVLLAELGYVVYSIHKSLRGTELRPTQASHSQDANDYLALSRRRLQPPSALRRFRIVGEFRAMDGNSQAR